MKSTVDEQFYVPRLPVNIVALPDSSYDVYPMRGLLEGFNCVTTVHWIGAPTDFLKVLGQGETAPRYLLIAGHGDENGYYLGEYASFIDTSMLHGQHMPAEVIAPVVNLPGCTVISSACGAGAERMGHAFVDTGRINAFIACRADPHSEDMLVFLVNFFHSVLRKKQSDRDAWLRAMAVTDQPEIYQMSFFHSNGTEERYEQVIENPER
jgi:hypothetical protein